MALPPQFIKKGAGDGPQKSGKAAPKKEAKEPASELAKDVTDLRQVLTSNGVTGAQASKIVKDFRATNG